MQFIFGVFDVFVYVYLLVVCGVIIDCFNGIYLCL